MEVRFMKSSLSDVLASTATVMFEMDPSRVCLIPRDERVQRVADASKDRDFFSGLFWGLTLSGMIWLSLAVLAIQALGS